MSTSDAQYQVHSQLSGGHWVAWLTAGDDTQPAGSVVLVGQTQEEAEANARGWAERLNDDPRLRRRQA